MKMGVNGGIDVVINID
jgi:hypothetical protein